MYSLLASYYDELMTLDYSAYLDTWKSLVHFQGDDLFEFGCGTGNVTEKLLPLVNSIDAADSSPEMLMVARQKLNSPKLRWYLLDEEFSIHRTYDKIGLFVDVVNYLSPEYFQTLLAEWHDWLKPGGEILFDVSNEFKLSTILGQQIFRFDTEDGEIYWINEYDEEQKQLDFSLVFYNQTTEETFTREEEYHTQYVYDQSMVRQLAKGYDVSVFTTHDRDYYVLRKTK